MFKRLNSVKEFRFTPLLAVLLSGVLMITSEQAKAETDPLMHSPANPTFESHLTGDKVSQVVSPAVTTFGSLTPVSDVPPEFVQPKIENDPLNSPFPIPWEWILTTQAEFTDQGISGLRYYRSPSLVSPDGQYAVYTRVSFSVEPEMFRSRVTSVMFLENLQTGELQVIRSQSPFGDHLEQENQEELIPGIMSILIPVSWSEDGNHLLSRQFEGVFSTSDACDYAVIWNRQSGQTHTISPNKLDYTTAILMGWNSSNPEQILFRAGFLGDEDWPVVSVALDGQTVLASNHESITYGQLTTSVWSGSQALK